MKHYFLLLYLNFNENGFTCAKPHRQICDFMGRFPNKTTNRYGIKGSKEFESEKQKWAAFRSPTSTYRKPDLQIRREPLDKGWRLEDGVGWRRPSDPIPATQYKMEEWCWGYLEAVQTLDFSKLILRLTISLEQCPWSWTNMSWCTWLNFLLRTHISEEIIKLPNMCQPLQPFSNHEYNFIEIMKRVNGQKS